MSNKTILVNALNTTTPRPELFASVTSSDTEGLLDVNVTSEVNNRPIDGAQVQITRDSDPGQIIEQTTTNSIGQIPELTLPAPPVDYSMEPGANKPYEEYTITITAPGFEPFRVSGAEIFSGETAIQNASLLPASPAISGDTELLSSRIIRFGEIIRQRLQKMRSNQLMRPVRSY